MDNKQREYYSCDATYRNWLEIELKNASVSPIGLSSEEKDRAIAVAGETLSSSLSLLLSKFTNILPSCSNSSKLFTLTRLGAIIYKEIYRKPIIDVICTLRM